MREGKQLMTIGELKEKLSLYKDDTEIFIGNYDEIMGYMTYSDPWVDQQQVEAYYSKTGHLCYSKFMYPRGHKHATILVIGS
jgi:hypothetical protein